MSPSKCSILYYDDGDSRLEQFSGHPLEYNGVLEENGDVLIDSMDFRVFLCTAIVVEVRGEDEAQAACRRYGLLLHYVSSLSLEFCWRTRHKKR